MIWLLLLHQIPPKPAYLRAKALRRLNQLGALSIKNSAYLLPANEETLEDLQWVRREIEEQGGEAWIFHADALAGLSNSGICEAFRALRKPDYDELLATARKLRDAASSALSASHESEWRKLKRRYDEMRRIDFFGAPGSEEMETIMRTIDRTLHTPAATSAAKPALADVKGRKWITRRGIKIDRTGSAWLIRRFIDPAAEFVFVDLDKYKHDGAGIRFDMFEGEFTHEGDLCTFELLLAWSGAQDPALQAVAEIVHDIDLKDKKYQRPETAGIAAAIGGIALRHTEDEQRLADGLMLFDSLYERLRSVG